MTLRILLALLVVQLLPALDIALAKPEAAGMSAERLARIDAWLEGMVDKKQAAGFVSLVARRGKVVHHQAFGKLGMSSREPMPLNALFDIASMTKPLTAAAALMLYEEGLLTLSDPISAHLPEFKNPSVLVRPGKVVPAEREILVRDLFTHSSGVSDPGSRAETYAYPTMKAYMADFVKLPLASHPGERWVYGDSLDVLGFLVERISGMGLDAFFEQRILGPLEMNDTHYWPPAAKEARRASLVVNGKDDTTRESREPLSASKAKTFIAGASGLHTTAADYWRFCQMLLDGGASNGRHLLGPRTVELINDDHLDPATDFRPGQRFGLGFAVVTDRARAALPYSEGSYYWGGSQGTVFWIDPHEELIGVLMVQVRPAGHLQLRQKFGALVYSSIVD